VLQGLTFGPLIRVFRFEEDRVLEQEVLLARERAAAAALARLDELGRDGRHHGKIIPEQHERLRDHYSRRAQRFAASGKVDPECTLETAEADRRLRYEALHAERTVLISLRNDGTISDEVLHRLEHELDVEALRLGLGEHRVGN
jgi:CPA1 family monovalent cation:H+ antiporter